MMKFVIKLIKEVRQIDKVTSFDVKSKVLFLHRNLVTMMALKLINLFIIRGKEFLGDSLSKGKHFSVIDF